MWGETKYLEFVSWKIVWLKDTEAWIKYVLLGDLVKKKKERKKKDWSVRDPFTLWRHTVWIVSVRKHFIQQVFEMMKNAWRSELGQWRNDFVWKWFSRRQKCDILTGFESLWKHCTPYDFAVLFLWLFCRRARRHVHNNYKVGINLHGIGYHVPVWFFSSVLFNSSTFPSVLFKCLATVVADTVYPNGVGRASLSGLANG